jgi:hypothetical protein
MQKAKMTNERFLELSADMAEHLVDVEMNYYNVIEVKEDGTEGYTEEAQANFNATLEIVQHHLLNAIEIVSE